MPTAVKFLSKKSGLPIDVAVPQLVQDGWLEGSGDETTDINNFLELLRTNPKALSRGKVAGEQTADGMTDAQREEAERLEREANPETDEPPEGPYVEMAAEDLPMGKDLAMEILEDLS